MVQYMFCIDITILSGCPTSTYMHVFYAGNIHSSQLTITKKVAACTFYQNAQRASSKND